MKIEKGVYHTQTKGCKLCIHVGMTAIYIGKKRKNGKQGFYLQVFTPFKFFKLS